MSNRVTLLSPSLPLDSRLYGAHPYTPPSVHGLSNEFGHTSEEIIRERTLPSRGHTSAPNARLSSDVDASKGGVGAIHAASVRSGLTSRDSSRSRRSDPARRGLMQESLSWMARHPVGCTGAHRSQGVRGLGDERTTRTYLIDEAAQVRLARRAERRCGNMRKTAAAFLSSFLKKPVGCRPHPGN